MNEAIIKALLVHTTKQMDKIHHSDPAFRELADFLIPQKDNKVLSAFHRKLIELTVRECMEQVYYTREEMIDGTISQHIKARMEQRFGINE